MSISLFIIGIVVGGIATLVTVIFTIISLATGKGQAAAAWGVGFVISISILILSIFHVVRRVGEKVKSGVEWIEEHKNEFDNPKTDDSYSKSQRQNYLDSLEKYTVDSRRTKMPSDFYANKKAEKDANGKYIIPFIYPLSVRYDELSQTGEIINDVNDSVFLSHITEISFDENFAIARVNNAGDTKLLQEGHGEVEYILFDLRTCEYLNFVSREQLIEKAGKIGYTGPSIMYALPDLYQGFLGPMTFDF